MGRPITRQTGGVFRRLCLNAGEPALGFGLYCAEGLAVEKEQIVGETKSGLHRELADGDAAAGRHVEVVSILNEPARCRQIRVDLAAGSLFGCFRHQFLSSGPPATMARTTFQSTSLLSTMNSSLPAVPVGVGRVSSAAKKEWSGKGFLWRGSAWFAYYGRHGSGDVT